MHELERRLPEILDRLAAEGQELIIGFEQAGPKAPPHC